MKAEDPLRMLRCSVITDIWEIQTNMRQSWSGSLS